MADMAKLVEVMNVMLKYLPKEKSHEVAAEHDIVYFEGPDPLKLSPEDRDVIDEAGVTYEGDDRWSIFV
jgi:hypothetical protein